MQEHRFTESSLKGTLPSDSCPMQVELISEAGLVYVNFPQSKLTAQAAMLTTRLTPRPGFDVETLTDQG